MLTYTLRAEFTTLSVIHVISITSLTHIESTSLVSAVLVELGEYLTHGSVKH